MQTPKSEFLGHSKRLYLAFIRFRHIAFPSVCTNSPPATDENASVLQTLPSLDFELWVFEGWGMALTVFAVHTAWHSKSHTVDAACF